MDKVATTVTARWDQLEQDIAGTKFRHRARLLPVLQAMRRHPRIGQLVPNTSHNMLFLAQTTRDYWSCSLPYLEAVAPGQFRVYGGEYPHVYRMIQDATWRDEDHDVLGVGNADQAVAWLDAALPVPFIPAIDGDVDDLRHLQGLFVLTQDEKDILVAAFCGRATDVLRYLDAGVSPNVTDYYGCTALIDAVCGGLAEAKHALNIRDPEVSKVLTDVDRALVSSATKGQLEVISLLIARGANVSQEMPNGATAITIAEKEGTWPEIVEFLRSLLPAG